MSSLFSSTSRHSPPSRSLALHFLTGTMGFSGVLLRIFLFSLLCPIVWSDIGNLQEIINFLQTNYGGGGQFAVAINVPAAMCNTGVVPDQNFLPNDENINVIADMAGPDKVYKGQQLIGAKPKPIPMSAAKYHSEYLLMIQSNPTTPQPYDPLMKELMDKPLMKELMDKDPNGCVVFYTFNSPCVNTCSTPNKLYSIIPALNAFTSHIGPKAFVFNQVWRYDGGSTDWESNIKTINDLVPIYRCNNAGCTNCVDNNNIVATTCLQ